MKEDMKKEKLSETDDILGILADNLKNHLIYIMKASGKEINKEEAENMLSNIGMFVLKQRLKKGI
jgi:hypothetical protein